MTALDAIEEQVRALREAAVALALELRDRAACGDGHMRELAAQASRLVDRAVLLADTLDEIRAGR